MPAKRESQKAKPAKAPATKQQHAARPSALLDTRIILCGDCLEQLRREVDAFFRKSGKVIVALTVREILDEEIAKKLA